MNNYAQNWIRLGSLVYAYGGASTFPTQVWNASNYWVDVVFTTAL